MTRYQEYNIATMVSYVNDNIFTFTDQIGLPINTQQKKNPATAMIRKLRDITSNTG